MDRTSLVDLKKKVFIRSTLLSIGDLDELLGLNDNLTSDEVLLEIFKKSLKEFEQTCPLILEMKVNKEQMETCYGMPGWGEFKSNFTLFLDCIISEDQIVLPPVSIPQWRIGTSSYPTPLAYTYFTDYRKPYVFLGDIPSNGQFFVRGICARPIIPDFLSDGTFNPASKKGAIYWMDVENGGSKGEFFVNLCLCNLLDYIRQLKASVTLPNMSVDVLGNVDSAYQELRQKCDVYALQSGWYGDLLL